MTMLKPLEFPDMDGDPGDAESLRSGIAGIVAALTTHFDATGMVLVDAVAAIDKVVAALREVASVFDTGEAAGAVNDLIAAAEDLCMVETKAAARADQIARIRTSSATLRSCAGEILRCIQVLDIYGMNVKITASGVAVFMEFADRMREKLNVAGREVLSLDEALEMLENSLRKMRHDDALLVAECAKILPHVPDRLMRHAAALRQHQAGLVRLAQSTNTVAQEIRGELAQALGAIQIGDRVRQRLEHVLFGCQLLEAAAPSGAVAEALCHYAMPLLGALTTAAAEEFDREGHLLLTSLHRLKDTSGQLTALQQPGGDETGQGFLGELEGGVAEAEGMVAQFGQADRQGAATLEQILQTVDIVAAKMAAITELRLEVRNMAINIGLSCRNIGDRGKPIMVVANEIRTYSDRLDLIISDIADAERDLLETSSHMSMKGAEGGASVDQLAQFLGIIHDCNDRTGKALDIVDAQAVDMHRLLGEAIAQLDGLFAMTPDLAGLAPSSASVGDSAATCPEEAATAVEAFFAAMAGKYTMKDERDVHDLCAPQFVEKISDCNNQDNSISSDDDEDGLF